MPTCDFFAQDGCFIVALESSAKEEGPGVVERYEGQGVGGGRKGRWLSGAKERKAHGKNNVINLGHDELLQSRFHVKDSLRGVTIENVLLFDFDGCRLHFVLCQLSLLFRL